MLGSVVLYFLLVAPRRARDPQRLLTCLSAGGHPTLFIDVQTLREAGVLDRIAGAEAIEEAEYKGFVEATGFDYRKDLDAVAVRFAPTARLMVVRGRFDKAKLAGFAKGRGGRCVGELCTVEGSARDRQISWVALDGDLLGVAVGPDPLAATILAKGSRVPEPLPPAPVWLALPGSVLEARDGLPPGLSALLSSLGGASRATFTINGSDAGFDVRLVAPFDDRLRAEASAKRLREATAALKTLMERSGTAAPAGSLGAVLAGGSFDADQTRVRAMTLPASFLKAGRRSLAADCRGGCAPNRVKPGAPAEKVAWPSSNGILILSPVDVSTGSTSDGSTDLQLHVAMKLARRSKRWRGLCHLGTYTRFHFQIEERLMRLHGYPDLAEHLRSLDS